MDTNNDQQQHDQKTPKMNWDQDSKFDPVALALHELDLVIEAQERFTAMWGHWWQRDEIQTPEDRRAEDRVRNEANELSKRRIATTANLILEVRHLITKEREKGSKTE